MECNEETEEHHYGSSCKRCRYTVFWLFCIVLFVLQFTFGVWSAVLQFLLANYVLFSIILVPLVIPVVLLSIISFVWYRDQDKVNAYLRETHPDDRNFRNFKPLVGLGMGLSHITGFGILYRYGQLMMCTARNSRSCDLLSLQRDSLLLQFLLGFLTSAPLVVIHSYQVLLDYESNNSSLDLSWPIFPIVLSSLTVSSLSLLFTLLSYIANDRLHAEPRRVVFPAHLAAFVWHFCMVVGRIMALALFAVAFEPYVSIPIGLHWIITFAWTLFERTNFCGDVTVTPPKKRLYLEIPFVFVISFVYLFLFFNIRDGPTMSRIIVYHVLTSVETLVLAALFFAILPNLVISSWLFAFTIGFYIMGVAFMSLYYAAWHPNRTEDCFMVGLPHACDCCQLFHKEPAEVTGNVDLPLDTPPIEMGGHSFTPMEQVNGIVAMTEDNSGGVLLTDYDPLDNLSFLTQKQPTYTVRQLSRDLTITPTSTPQHSGNSRGRSSRLYSEMRTDAFKDRGRRGLGGSRANNRSFQPDYFYSSTPNDGSRARNMSRPMSVTMEERSSFPMDMGQRSMSEDTGVGPELSSTGIGQLLARGPPPETTDVDIPFSFTPVHQRQSRKTAPPMGVHRRTGESENRSRDAHLRSKNITSRTAPLSRRSEDFTSNSKSRGKAHSVEQKRRNTYSFHNYSGTVVLPSPIGEEPGGSGVGYQIVSPVVLQVNGKSPSVGQINSSHLEPIYSQVQQPKVTVDSSSTVPSAQRANKWSDIHYTELTPFRSSHNAKYVDMPIRTTRQRSLSPINDRPGSRRSSPNSGGARSMNCTPKHSPYIGRHRNPSNPLHSHDPMQEFTQLYSTSSPSAYNRERFSMSGERKVTNKTSTSSSYIISSDNHSDTDNGGLTEDEAQTATNTSGLVGHKHTHRHANRQHTHYATVGNPIIAGRLLQDTTKVTAHRQNSDEFLVTKLHNITGTLV